MDPLERIIRPIVEGQVRSFANDHPEVVEAVDWYRPRKDKKLTFVNSVSKRIIRDLLCPETRMRLMAAMLHFSGEAADDPAMRSGVATATLSGGAGPATGLSGSDKGEVALLPACPVAGVEIALPRPQGGEE